MLRAENIVTGYGTTKVIRSASLEAPKGDITTIIGPNGSGKSTFFKAISGVLDVWEGRVELFDEDLTEMRAHERVRNGISVVPQGGNVFPKMTVRENLLMGGYTVSSEKRAENIQRVYEEFPKLEAHSKKRAETLSGGQQTMLAIGRTMMTDATYLLMDEPSTGLSPGIIDQVFERIEQLNEERDKSFLIIEQNVRKALEITDWVYVLDQGTVRYHGHIDDFVSEDELIDMYIGKKSRTGNENDTDGTNEGSDSAGGEPA
jgi:branched-chain amino acid transport system ATP-binding protein